MKNRIATALGMAPIAAIIKARQDGVISIEAENAITNSFDEILASLLKGKEIKLSEGESFELSGNNHMFQITSFLVEQLIEDENSKDPTLKGYSE